jgi:hypothetical protein
MERDTLRHLAHPGSYRVEGESVFSSWLVRLHKRVVTRCGGGPSC